MNFVVAAIKEKFAREREPAPREPRKALLALDTIGQAGGHAAHARPPHAAGTARMILDPEDGTHCTFTGNEPYRFSVEIPAFAGRYECTAADGTPLGAGLFGMRATFVGKPFTSLE